MNHFTSAQWAVSAAYQELRDAQTFHRVSFEKLEQAHDLLDVNALGLGGQVAELWDPIQLAFGLNAKLVKQHRICLNHITSARDELLLMGKSLGQEVVA